MYKRRDTIDTLISKILDIIINPVNKLIVLAMFLTCGFLFLFNFVPENLLIRTNMLSFFNQYTYILVIIMVFTFFLLVVQIAAKWYKKREDKRFFEVLQREQNKLFEDYDAKLILNQLYENHPNSVCLPKNNQKVKLLLQFKLIHQASSVQLVTNYGANDPYFPYVLMPHAEERMKEIHGIKSSP